MDISVVIPVLNEEENIPLLFKSLVEVLDKLDRDYEIIFIDDGSTDKSFEILHKLHSDNEDIVKVIQFRGNFGKSQALHAGFKEAKGSIIFTMDGDLQDDPKNIPRFLEKLNQGYDMVSGWRYHRHDPIFKTLPSKIYNILTRYVAGVKLHDFNCGFKVYKKDILEEISIYGQLHRYIPVLAHWRNFKIDEIRIVHHPRKYGKSKYGYKRFTAGFFDFITVIFLTKFIKQPLHFFGVMGLLSVLAGFLINSYLTYLWFIGQGPIGNRPLLLLGVLLMIIGFQFFSIGLIGEMITNLLTKKEVGYSIKKKLISYIR